MLCLTEFVKSNRFVWTALCTPEVGRSQQYNLDDAFDVSRGCSLLTPALEFAVRDIFTDFGELALFLLKVDCVFLEEAILGRVLTRPQERAGFEAPGLDSLTSRALGRHWAKNLATHMWQKLCIFTWMRVPMG